MHWCTTDNPVNTPTQKTLKQHPNQIPKPPYNCPNHQQIKPPQPTRPDILIQAARTRQRLALRILGVITVEVLLMVVTARLEPAVVFDDLTRCQKNTDDNDQRPRTRKPAPVGKFKTDYAADHQHYDAENNRMAHGQHQVCSHRVLLLMRLVQWA